MKKCASCTKDLPDAALHCVFCGAKQPPAPAMSAAANAKTVMGYGGQELEALRAQAAAANASRASQPANPYAAPQPQYPSPHADAATVLVPADPVPRSHSPSAGGYGGAAGGHNPQPGGYNQHQHPTQPAGGYGAAAGGYNPQPGGGGYGGAPAGGYGAPAGGYGGGPAGYNPQPVAPVPSAQPPYLASQTAARAGRPIEPWKDAIRVQMTIWGVLLLVAFVTPLTIDPLAFNWDVVINAAGKAKLLPLLIAAVGVLAIVIGSIPMESVPRGAIAAVLGLAGIFVPIFILKGMPPWQVLVAYGGMVLLVPSLLVRDQYRDASLPRILVTVGVIAVLLPQLLPVGGKIPLVGQFQNVLDASGQYKVVAIVTLLQDVVVALALLAWLPSPASGASKAIAWTLLMWPLLLLGSTLFLEGAGGFDPTKAPFTAWLWLVGATGVGSAFLAIASYGIATLIGKQLE